MQKLKRLDRMGLNSNAQNFRTLTGILEIPAEELLSNLLSNSQISSAVVASMKN